MSAVDVVYLKNVLLKFIAAQSAGKTQVQGSAATAAIFLPGCLCSVSVIQLSNIAMAPQ